MITKSCDSILDYLSDRASVLFVAVLLILIPMLFILFIAGQVEKSRQEDAAKPQCVETR